MRHWTTKACTITGLLLGASAWAEPTCTAGVPVLSAVAECDFGAPVRSGELLLVPKICRFVQGDQRLDRHAVEVRKLPEGARLGQASLPPIRSTADTPLPAPGVVLGGAYPLLVTSAGIAAVDPRAQRAEPVFEAEGTLLGVARHGELLAIAEGRKPDERFPKGSVEWTVLDFGAGELLGQAQLAGPDLDDLALRKAKDGAVQAVLVRKLDGKRVEVVAPVRDAQGKSAIQDGALRAKVVPAPAQTTGSGTGQGCPKIVQSERVLPGQAALVASLDGKRRRLPAEGDRLAAPGPDTCLALAELDDQGAGFAWYATPAGKLELRRVTCK